MKRYTIQRVNYKACVFFGRYWRNEIFTVIGDATNHSNYEHLFNYVEPRIMCY